VKKAIRIDREVWENDDETAQRICRLYTLEAIDKSLVQDEFQVNKTGNTRYLIEVSIDNDIPNFYFGNDAPKNDPNYVNALIDISVTRRKNR
jgi:hypothetical protein